MAATSFFGGAFFGGEFFNTPTPPTPGTLTGGHFGFDEKKRGKRFDQEREEEEKRKEALRVAFYGLPVEEREEISSAPEQTIEAAAATPELSRVLMQRIAAIMEEHEDENDLLAMFMKGEI